jgi:hypothetical protein
MCAPDEEPWRMLLSVRAACALVIVSVPLLAAGCGSDFDGARSPRAAVKTLLAAANDRDAQAACAVSRGELALGCDGAIEEATAADAATAQEPGVRWRARHRGDAVTVTLRHGRWHAEFELVRRSDRWQVASWQSYSSSS